MQLLCNRRRDEIEPSEDPMYVAVKSAILHNETKSVLSIRLLQAHILTALYETAQAIYPEAYLTIGRCARIGQLMGIHSADTSPQLLGRLSWCTQCVVESMATANTNLSVIG